MIKKKKNKQDKIILLTKSRLNSIEVLISKALIDSNISHDEFVLINNVLKEHYDIKEIKIPITNKKSNYIYKRVLPYCLKCRKNKQSKNPEVVKTKNGRIMLLSTYSVGNSKKSKSLKEQEARGLLSSLEIRTFLGEIPLLGPLLFEMNETINRFLLARETFMPEMHLKQPEFKYSASALFTKNKERIKKLKKQDIQDILIHELDKASFHHDMAYRDFKDLYRRTSADKILSDKAFNIAKDPKSDGYQRGLAEELHKPMIRNFN